MPNFIKIIINGYFGVIESQAIFIFSLNIYVFQTFYNEYACIFTNKKNMCYC